MAGATAQLVPRTAFLADCQQSISAAPVRSFPPINFIYGHFHNSIRAELGLLADRVRSLEAPGEGVDAMLGDLRERYKFLEQVYKYHSTVEDEVLYPVLDSKVRNVTLAYSIEHQDEEILFEQLSQLLSTALEEPEAKRKGTIRTLICKVEEIHTTLRKHLAKEEEQLLPLLLQHFSFAEQAELVAQFLYSIPLETVERVLSQLKPRIPREEQEQLLEEIQNVIPDNLLSQLLTTWLQPAAHFPAPEVPPAASVTRSPAFTCCGNPAACSYGQPSQPSQTAAPAAAPPARAAAPPTVTVATQRMESGEGGPLCAGASPAYSSCTAAAGGSGMMDMAGATALTPEAPAASSPCGTAAVGTAGQAAASIAAATAAAVAAAAAAAAVAAAAAAAAVAARSGGEGPASCSGRRAPLQEIIHFHRSICASLGEFAREARALQLGREITAAQLSSLLERHRFLRSVYVFHSISEEEVLFPEVQRLTAHVGGVAARQCEKDHQAELSSFEDLGRLLADVRAFARRGRKEVSSMLEKLCCSAEAVHASIEHHMQREEADVFPLLEAHLCEAQQRALVYRTIRAMPLRLLERVMPWVVSRLDDAAASAMLSNIRLGAPGSDQALVELLSRWARRGRRGISPLPGAAEPSSGARADSSDGPEMAGGTAAGAGAADGEGPAEAWTGVDHFALCTATCGPRFLRDSHPGSTTGYAASAIGEDGADSKRRRVSEELIRASASARPHGHNTHHAGRPHPQHQQQQPRRGGSGGGGGCDAAAAAAAGLYGMDLDDGDLAEGEMSTAPRALLMGGGQQGSSPEERAAAMEAEQERRLSGSSGGLGAASAEAGAGGGFGSGGGYNPIDHIFQFHKALRQELKQLEADAMALEHTVLSRVRQHSHHHHHPHATIHQPQPQRLGSQGPGQPPLGTPPRRTPTPGAGAEPGSADGAGVPYSRGGLLPVVQHLHGRFQFLQGIYRAHSKAEDEIVFPALEAKQALRNVSHAYTLDHRQEEQLFADLEQVIDNLRAVDLHSAGAEAELSRQVMSVRRMCAAIRASLETHIRSEESELWPLFTEHFSREEQQYLVGVIIGRTGAQVLQALLPWVSETFSEEEKDAMMDSLREATRNTMFDQWLEAVQAGGPAGVAAAAAAAAATAGAGPVAAAGSADGDTVVDAGAAAAAEQVRLSHQQPLQQVADYLAGGSGSVSGGTEGAAGAGPCGGPCAAAGAQQSGGAAQGGCGGAAGGAAVAAAAPSFRPGWEDIFRMNQQQLEAAIHRVSNDSTLEPERKAYLMQNIMVSKYIVAQQRRMCDAEVANDALQAAAGAAAGPAASAAAAAASVQGSSAGPVVAAANAAAWPGGAAAAATAVVAAAVAAAAPAAPIHRTFHDAAAGVLGCPHYQRKCQLVAPCCSQVFTCRLCHDEAADHRMDRYAVSEMRCMRCGERQPVAGSCRACASPMARYVCNICHLFDDEPGKDIYHCPFCNVCRRGRGLGVDFFHCMNCNACMSLSLFTTHKCREKCIEGNCPVCHESLFDSSQPIKELPCGHFMHSTCFSTYTRYNYTCPLCCKSVGDMSVYFQMLDSLLASERLPPEYSGRMQQVLCNDCGKLGFAPFHFVYHSCPHCRSYNTRVM